MEIEVDRINISNAIIKATVESKEYTDKLNKIAKKDLGHVKMDGFRAGKTPMAMIKKKFSKELQESTEQALIQEIFEDGLVKIGVNKEDVLGEPYFDKFDKKDQKIDLVLKVALKPIFKIEDYVSCIPDVRSQKVTKKEITQRIVKIGSNQAKLVEVKGRDIVADKDMITLDFEGFIDGKAFDGGKADDFLLEIGSKSFIGDFEKQLIGLKIKEKKDVIVSFPKDYQKADLQGKRATFKVVVKTIKEKVEPVIDDALAQKILASSPDTKDKKVTLKTLEDEIKKVILKEKKDNYYLDIKKVFFDKLVSKFGNFVLPENILEQEVVAIARQKINEMGDKAIEELKNNDKKIDEIKTSCTPEAEDRVKLTFIIDAISKRENISISDQQLMQEVYMEAMQTGRDPKETYESYKKNNLMPALKMALVEEVLTEKLFDQKANDKKETKEVTKK